MNRENVINEIKQQKDCKDLLEASKNGMYKCPFCNSGNGKHRTGAAKINKDNTFHCFSCGKHVDVIDLYAERYNCDVKTAINELAQELHLYIDNEHEAKTSRDPKGARQKKEPDTIKIVADFSAYFKECVNNLSLPEARAYLMQRGIEEETAELFSIGYDTKEKRLIIPCSNTWYEARAISEDIQPRYKNPSASNGAVKTFFNIEAIYNADNEPVFITEGTFDALAIISAGYRAISLNSTTQKDKFCKLLEENHTDNTLIIALDNDDTGAKAQESLIEQLKALDIEIIEADAKSLYLGLTDASEAYTTDKAAFKQQLELLAGKFSKKPDNVKDFILSAMGGKIEEYKQGENIKTGFDNLDKKAGSIHAGLYVIGAISSLGKTTFMHQIADQLAEQGQHVLFFSLEQSMLELVSKSISRKTAQLNYDKAVTSLDIRYGCDAPIVQEAKKAYIETVADRLSIIEGNFSCDVPFIRGKIERYMKQNNTRPVVIVDYLQILPPEQKANSRPITDPKIITDANITELKKISRDLAVPVFVISSINRSNYINVLDFSSFKESGAIEYTADVVWGLQLACVSENEIFKSESKINEKRELIRKEKSKLPRDIQLVCLKNRYGISDYAVKFKYYPNYDLFKCADEWQPAGKQTPFKVGALTV